MDSVNEARRIRGARSFLIELEQFAAECARVGAVIDDELAPPPPAAQRRAPRRSQQRGDPGESTVILLPPLPELDRDVEADAYAAVGWTASRSTSATAYAAMPVPSPV